MENTDLLEQILEVKLRTNNILYITRTFSMFNDTDELIVVHIYDTKTNGVSKIPKDYEEAQIICRDFTEVLNSSEILGKLLKACRGLLDDSEYSLDLNGRVANILRGLDVDVAKSRCKDIEAEL